MDLTLLLCVGILIILFACGVCTKSRGVDFEARFPPISDAEFVARCTPGTDPTVALKVRRILADNLGVEYERIHPSARIADDFGAD